MNVWHIRNGINLIENFAMNFDSPKPSPENSRSVYSLNEPSIGADLLGFNFEYGGAAVLKAASQTSHWKNWSEEERKKSHLFVLAAPLTPSRWRGSLAVRIPPRQPTQGALNRAKFTRYSGKV